VDLVRRKASKISLLIKVKQQNFGAKDMYPEKASSDQVSRHSAEKKGSITEPPLVTGGSEHVKSPVMMIP
jgi:hypothetical protein